MSTRTNAGGCPQLSINNLTDPVKSFNRNQIDSHQYSLSLAEPALGKLALKNRVLQFSKAPSGGYSATITLKIPVEFSEAEAKYLSRQTDDWPGWGLRPSLTLAELGQLIERVVSGKGGAA